MQMAEIFIKYLCVIYIADKVAEIAL